MEKEVGFTLKGRGLSLVFLPEHSTRASCLRVVPGLLLQPGQGMCARTKEKNRTNKKWNWCCNSWTERKYGSGRTAWVEARPAEPAWGASHRDLRKGSQPGLQAEAGSFWAGALGRTGPVGCLGRAPEGAGVRHTRPRTAWEERDFHYKRVKKPWVRLMQEFM